MIAITLSHIYSDTPQWWKVITGDLPSPSPRTWQEFRTEVDRRMIEHGGRYRQKRIGEPILVTFRDESMYTAFLLRFA